MYLLSKVERGEREEREGAIVTVSADWRWEKDQKRRPSNRCMPLAVYNDVYKIIFSGLKDWPVPVLLLCSFKLGMKKEARESKNWISATKC
jgi:hypothetical protein